MTQVTNYYEQLESLQQVKTALLNEFREAFTDDKIERLMPLMKQNEADIKEVKIGLKVQQVNREQQSKREAARIAWNAEQPIIDVTNNDGSFHSVKIKKYPNLGLCSSAKFVDGVYNEIRVGQYKFYMHTTKSEYQKPTIYTRPDTFEDFLRLNSIMVEDMTIEKYNEINEQMLQAREALNEAQKVYDDKMKGLGSHSLSFVGLVSQDRDGIYTMNF